MLAFWILYSLPLSFCLICPLLSYLPVKILFIIQGSVEILLPHDSLPNHTFAIHIPFPYNFVGYIVQLTWFLLLDFKCLKSRDFLIPHPIILHILETQ